MKKHQKSWTVFHSLLFIAFLGILSTTVYSQQQNSTSSDPYPPATVPDTEVRTIYSKILNQEMYISIKLPMFYKISVDKKYPCWNYPGFSVESYIFPEETHQSCMAASLMRGFVVINKK